MVIAWSGAPVRQVVVREIAAPGGGESRLCTAVIEVSKHNRRFVARAHASPLEAHDPRDRCAIPGDASGPRRSLLTWVAKVVGCGGECRERCRRLAALAGLQPGGTA